MDRAVASPAVGRPHVARPYPGPRARAVLERMRRVEGAGLRTGGDGLGLVVERAEGSFLEDPDGNRFVDLYASFAAATLGHAHPEVVAAVRDQVGRLSHASSAFGSEIRAAFEESLVALSPEGLDRVLLGISGSDANDTAIRLARTLTGRREVVAFTGGYLGRGSGVVGLNGKVAFRTRVGRDVDAHFFPFPDPYRWRLGPAEAAGDQALMLLEDALEGGASGVGPIAAIVVEPVQGNGGVVVPPDGFLAGLRSLADRHGIVLVFDEVQSGFGRTGRLWAAEHWDVVPDLMTVGKGIGGGMAVSGVVGRADFMGHWPPGSHTSTFLANAVNLAAGQAALGIMARDRLWERAARLGEPLIDRLRADLADVPAVGDVRGLGLFIGIEIVVERGTRRPDPVRAAAIRDTALLRGVVIGGGGHHENVLKLSPPLTIDEELLADASRIVVDVIREVS